MSTPDLSNLEASIFVSDCHYLGGLKFMVDMKKPPIWQCWNPTAQFLWGKFDTPSLREFLGWPIVHFWVALKFISCRFSEERFPFIKGFLTFGWWFSHFFPTIPICWGVLGSPLWWISPKSQRNTSQESTTNPTT